MKRVGTYAVLLALFLTPSSARSQVSPQEDPAPRQEDGLPFFAKHYTPQDYREQGQNWAVAQDAQGVVYVANFSSILAYDGVSWTAIRTAPNIARSLAVGSDDRVYVGLYGDFGYLKPDSTGTTRYVSLLDQVSEKDRSVLTDIWGTRAADQGIYFQSNERLFRWDGRSMKRWTSESGFHTSFAVHDELYVREIGVGLQRVVGDALQLVPAGERFANRPVYMMAPYGPDQTLIGTRRGLYLYDGQTLTPFETEATAYLENLYHGTALPGGYFALATLGDGVVIIDAEGRLVRVLDEASDTLADDWVNYVFADAQGGLWMAFNNRGIARVDTPSPLSIFDRRLGLHGTVRYITRHRGRLHVATSTGLYRLDAEPAAAAGSLPRPAFTKVRKMPFRDAWSLLSLNDGLLVATSKGIYQVQEPSGEGSPAGNVRVDTMLMKRPVYTLVASEHHPGRVYAGTSHGVAVLTATGEGWAVERELAPVDKEINSLVEEADGTLWASSPYGKVWRLRFAEGPEVDVRAAASFRTEDVLPGREVMLQRIGGKVAFASMRGVFRLAESSEEGFEPVAHKDTVLMPPEHDTEDSLLTIGEDETGRVWVVHEHGTCVILPQEDGTYEHVHPAALHFRRRIAPQLFVEGDVAWIGNGNTLVRYDARVPKTYEDRFAASIRQVHTLTTNRTLVAEGAEGPAGRPATTRRLLDYEDRDLYVEVAAPSFNDVDETQYQYLLQGQEDAWSPWTSEARRTYASLGEGTYTLRVRARNAQGVTSTEARFRFRILPPWYRTWWAYSLYLGVLVLGTVLVWRYRQIMQENRRAQHQAEELARERVVNERLQHANQRLHHANQSLHQANKLKDEFLANTSHELRTPLTAILGFTAVLQEELTGEHQEFLGLIEANGQRLLTTVNSLLDLAKLRAGVMEMNVEEVNINRQADKIVQLLSPLARQKHLEMRLACPDAQLFAHLDRQCLEQVLYNLVGNAIKFTEAGHVTVAVAHAEDTDTVHITVEDTGIGIDGAFLPYLFEEFKQESSGLSRSHEGSGLGLSITSRIVEMMQGAIFVESEKGRGSAFTLAFPLSGVVADRTADLEKVPAAS